jgi:hypothetical protein
MTISPFHPSCGPQPFHGGGDAFAVIENCRPGHQHVGSRGNRQRSSCHIDPAVHLQVAPGFGSIDHLARTSDQHLVEVWHDLFQNGRGSRRVDGDADPLSQCLDALHGARQVVVAFPVDQERIGPGLRKLVDKKIGVRDHQVRLQRQMRRPPQRSDDRCSHGNVGHEMSIHHVHVDAIRAGTLSLGHLIAQVGEIGREDRRSELHYIGRHMAPLSLRYRRIRLSVELSWPSLGSVLPSSSGMMRWARTLPSSTPH